MDGSSDGPQPGAAARQKTVLNLYLTVAAPIFLGLFFLEYPPLFLMGYWSWSALVHKTLSGIFLILNLAVAEYAVRRSRKSRTALQGAMAAENQRGQGGSGAQETPPAESKGA